MQIKKIAITVNTDKQDYKIVFVNLDKIQSLMDDKEMTFSEFIKDLITANRHNTKNNARNL